MSAPVARLIAHCQTSDRCPRRGLVPATKIVWFGLCPRRGFVPATDQVVLTPSAQRAIRRLQPTLRTTPATHRLDPGADRRPRPQKPPTPRRHLARRPRALDRLIGAWDATAGRRIDGAGFHTVAELDPQAPNPQPSTVNAGSGLHIDHILVNQATINTADVVAGSYRVHIPPGTNPTDWPSDHRRISCTLQIRTGNPPPRASPHDVTSHPTRSARK
jgi:hypothetical protein